MRKMNIQHKRPDVADLLYYLDSAEKSNFLITLLYKSIG